MINPMPTPAPHISLRPVTRADLPTLFDMQGDPEANALAGTKPRERAAFDSIWARILDTPSGDVFARSIIAADALIGCINIFPREGAEYIGYWIHRDHWGRGVATRAIALILAEYPRRPLFAQVVAHNTASIRALQRNGFHEIERKHLPADDRYVAAEVITLKLD